jgi:beta-barrel assembly-enhancing protease
MKLIKPKHWLPFLFACPLLMHCSCDLMGTAGSLLVSEADEERLGLEFHTQLKDSVKAFPIFKTVTHADTIFQTYVTGLAKEIVAAIPTDDKPGYNFTFTIIDQPIENAFAVPGGYVYIYTGIIKKMQDESELVGVLGHEIAHVTQHHYRDQMAKSTAMAVLVNVLVGDQPGKLTELVTKSFMGLASLSLSRGNESDADTHGTEYEGLVKRNPLGIAKYFMRVPESGSDWFSTHPAPPNRVIDVNSQVNASTSLKPLSQDTTYNYTSRFLASTAAIRK